MVKKAAKEEVMVAVTGAAKEAARHQKPPTVGPSLSTSVSSFFGVAYLLLAWQPQQPQQQPHPPHSSQGLDQPSWCGQSHRG